MRALRVCLPVALAGALLTGPPAQAAPRATPDLPRPVVAAARAMHCDIVYTTRSSPGETPVFEGEGCTTRTHGFVTVRWYASAREARAYWVDGVLAGAPQAYIARRGRLFVIPEEVDGPYDEAAARFAARKIGGQALHGRA